MLYPWLQSIYQKITNAVKKGKGHHSLLFYGENGVGREHLVREVARFLICDGEKRPCSRCRHCRLFDAGNHPDVYVLDSLDGKEIGIDQVREMNDKLSEFSQQNGNKVVWICQSGRLTEPAANALLKTLEEPKQNTFFLLETDSLSLLPATVYSRCQRWQIGLPSERLSCLWLAEQFPEKTAEISSALLINGNRPLAALAMLAGEEMEERKTFLRCFWRFYMSCSPLALLPHFEKEKILIQLGWIESFVVDAVKAKSGIRSGWINGDLSEGIIRFAEQNSRQGLLEAWRILQKVRKNLMTVTGVNQELMLLEGLVELIEQVFERS